MLEVHDLAAQRGHARLFEGLSFEVGPGHALVVTGANGTGKTTLLRMLAGLSLPGRRRDPLGRQAGQHRSIGACARRSRSPVTRRR